MYSTTTTVLKASRDFGNFLMIPNPFPDFIYNSTEVKTLRCGKQAHLFHGDLYLSEEDRICPYCGTAMEVNQTFHTPLYHVPFGEACTGILVDKHQFLCPTCKRTVMQKIPFQAEHHRITRGLEAYIYGLLGDGLQHKEIARITGISPRVIGNIDRERLKALYTEDGKLKKPERQATAIAIDEFSLHRFHRYATSVIDLETGHIIWIQEGKKKDVVYDFIRHVGLDWMKRVKVVSCDMNSDFEEAFRELCPHLKIVFDRFHIVKNFNDKVITTVRREEQKRLEEAGDKEAAKSLKNSRYILLSNPETLARKDQMANEAKPGRRESAVFPVRSASRKGGNQARYEALLKENELFFAMDLVKEMLRRLFSRTTVEEMESDIEEIVQTCNSTNNIHFEKFAELIGNHADGIVSHAIFPVSSGKIEGINNMMKTIRRSAYGYNDDEYFFLKAMDQSRQIYIRNPKSHKIFQ